MFTDFCEMAAIALSNRIDFARYNEREERYMQLVKDYTKDDLQLFAECIGLITLIYQEDTDQDLLGRLYMELELANKHVGQYFTPYHLSKLTAGLIVKPEFVRQAIQENGFTTMLEPACGAGGMVIAYSNIMNSFGCQGHYHVTAIDIASVCVHMTYIQLYLMGVPAVVLHGNALMPQDKYDPWYTLAHVLGDWSRKNARQEPHLIMKRTKQPGETDAMHRTR